MFSCHRNLLQIGNVDQELSLLVNKLTILRRKIIQRSMFIRKLFDFELWFPSRIVGARLYVAMTSWQVEYVINKNYRNSLRNLIVGISGYKLLVARQNLFL